MFKSDFRFFGLAKFAFIFFIFLFAFLNGGCHRKHDENIQNRAQQRIPEVSSKDIRSVIDEADVTSRRGDAVKAIEILDKAIRDYPGNPDITLKIAIIYEREGDYEKALAACTSVLEVNPDNVDIIEETAVILYKLRDYEKSAKTYMDLIILSNADPDVPEETLQKARAGIASSYRAEPSNKEIRRLFEKVLSELNGKLKENRDDELLLKEKAEILRCAGLYDEAVRAYGEIEEVEDENLFVPLLTGRCYMEKGDFEAARLEFENTIKENPDNFRAYRNYGWYWRERSRIREGEESVVMLKKALEQYNKALEISPMDVDKSYHKFKIAQVKYYIWEKRGNEEDRQSAIKAFEEYVKSAPEWVSTDAAKNYVAQLKGKKVEIVNIRDENEIELSPAVK